MSLIHRPAFWLALASDIAALAYLTHAIAATVSP
jgi:hypothetical protein